MKMNVRIKEQRYDGNEQSIVDHIISVIHEIQLLSTNKNRNLSLTSLNLYKIPCGRTALTLCLPVMFSVL